MDASTSSLHGSGKPLLPADESIRRRSHHGLQMSTPEVSHAAAYSTVTLKSFQLHPLVRMFSFGKAIEQRKVAIYHSRTIAIILTLVHWIPFGAALTLLILNSSGIIVAAEVDVVQSNLYQFGAKLFELLMQASIATIILGIVRGQAVETEEGLPLGMLMASARTHDISYLWSSEFFGSIGRARFKHLRHYGGLFAIALLILLATVVGPSGAVLLLPRPVSLTQGRILALMLPTSVMFPARVGADHDNIFDNPSINHSLSSISDRDIGANNYAIKTPDSYESPDMSLTQEVYMNGFHAGQNETAGTGTIAHSCRKVFWERDTGNMLTNSFYASAPNALVSAILPWIGHMPNGGTPVDPSWAASVAKQPLIFSEWSSFNVYSNGTEIDALSSESSPYGEFGYMSLQDSYREYSSHVAFLRNNSAFGNVTKVFAFESTNHSATVVWIKPAPAFVANLTDNDEATWSVQAVVINAVWASADINATSEACVGNSFNAIKTARANVLLDPNDQFELIDIAPAWSQRLGESVLQSQHPDLNNWYNDTMDIISPRTVAASFALGLASIAYPFIGSALPIPRETTADGEGFGPGQIHSHLKYLHMPLDLGPEDYLDHLTRYVDFAGTLSLGSFTRYFFLIDNTDNATDLSELEQMIITSYRRGIGYSAETRTVKFALAVIGLYCLVALIHIVWTLFSGKASTSWNSVSELVMLALNSRTPEHIENTSAGVNTRKTFAETVGIRANEQGSLEIAFLDQKNVAAERVVENRPY